VALPAPTPGLVIRYSFLWREQAVRGLEEGEKDRPCAIVLTSARIDGGELVLVLPVTHSIPTDPELAVEIPADTKRRLGWTTRVRGSLSPMPTVSSGPGRTFARGTEVTLAR
jgi:hypothetical protein